MRLTQALTRAVQLRSKQPATIYGERTRNWGEVGERVTRFAAALRDLGLERGDRVAILALNSDCYIETFFATAWAGLVLVPLNTRWAVPENLFALRDAECRVLIVDEQFVDQVPTLRAESALEHFVYLGERQTPFGLRSCEAMIKATEPMDDECGRGLSDLFRLP